MCRYVGGLQLGHQRRVAYSLAVGSSPCSVEMNSAPIAVRATDLVAELCAAVPDRRPGSAGNSAAVDSVAALLRQAGWSVDTPSFPCLDWRTEGGTLTVGPDTVTLTPSPYGCGVSGSGIVVVARTEADLERGDLGGSILVLDGPLASEPLTPKEYPFYGSDDHGRIVATLEEARPLAMIAVTGRYPALCGALDPFPLIEDGDFSIPTANIRPTEAGPILASDGGRATIEIRSERWLGTARNVIATRGSQAHRVTVAAHIDTKPGTPGAVDNAAGVVAVVLLASLFAPEKYLDLPVGVELLIVNGEDHFAAPGEVAWLKDQEGRLDDIVLFANIDGAGYREGRTCFSMYNVPATVRSHIAASFEGWPDLASGPDWYQSDHAIFAMQGRAALAFTTEHVQAMLETLFHAATDTPDQVDARLLIGLASALESLISTWPV